MTWLWSIPGAVAAVGSLLLWFGVRGRRVDDHPICRRCGFDLFGKPPESEVCSECGADLRKERAIRDGRRVRRGWAVAFGVMTLAISLTVAGAGGYAAYTVTDWQARKPVWFLLREMRGTDAAVRDAAIVEANKRLAATTLSQANVDAIADHILAKQADWNAPWLKPLGDFVETAWGSAALSEERWRRYVRQAVRLNLKTRPRVRRGDPIPFVCEMAEYRTATRSRVVFRFEGAERNLGGVSLGAADASSTFALSGPLAGTIEAEEYAAEVSEGQHALKLDCRLTVHERKGARFVEQHTINAAAETKLDLCHPAQLTVASVYDEAKVNAMRQPIRGLTVYTAAPGLGPSVEVTFSCGALPAGIGYDVFLWSRGNWRQIGSIACPSNTPREWRIRCNEGDNSNVAAVLFEPSLDAAARTLDTTDVWAGGQLTFRQLPISTFRGSPRMNLRPAVRPARATTTLTTPAR